MATNAAFVACAPSARLLPESHPRILPRDFISRRASLPLSISSRASRLRRSADRRVKKPWTSNATVKEQEPDQVALQTTPLKEFLQELKSLGRVRLIVNTGVAVLESVTSFEKLYYHESARGEYANVMSREDNVDFHLLLEKVACARFVIGKTQTYMIRLVDVNDAVALTVLVMWNLGTAGEYDPGQVEAFQALLGKYGEEVKFSQ